MIFVYVTTSGLIRQFIHEPLFKGYCGSILLEFLEKFT